MWSFKSLAADLFPKGPKPPKKSVRPTDKGKKSTMTPRHGTSQLHKSRNHENGALIREYSYLSSWPRQEEADHLLRKLGSCVKPIMRKRGWHVGLLAEFYPDERGLLGLNVNHGQSIYVRLRHPSHSDRFLPFESCLDTLLHELVHIVHGPHDETFNRIWNELRDEWEELQVKGYTGEGFLTTGHQLGGRHIPSDELRRLARQQAKKELERHKSSGRRLGGRDSRHSAPNAAAGAAIKRNGISSTSCATGTKAAKQAAEDAASNGFRSRAEMDEANELAIQQAAFELMELEEATSIIQNETNPDPHAASTPFSDHHQNNTDTDFNEEGLTWDPTHGLRLAPARPRPQPEYRPPRPTTAPPIPFQSKPISRLVTEAEGKQNKGKRLASPSVSVERRPPPPSASSVPSRPWDCKTCTLINPPGRTHCEVCGREARPVAPTRHSTYDQIPQSTQFSRQSRPLHHQSYQSYPSQQPQQSQHSQQSLQQAASSSSVSGWSCLRCGTYMERSFWTCDLCGRMKDSS